MGRLEPLLHGLEIAAHGPRHCRLIVKTLIRYPGGRVRRWLLRRTLPWLKLVTTRKQLLTLKSRPWQPQAARRPATPLSARGAPRAGSAA